MEDCQVQEDGGNPSTHSIIVGPPCQLQQGEGAVLVVVGGGDPVVDRETH